MNDSQQDDLAPDVDRRDTVSLSELWCTLASEKKWVLGIPLFFLGLAFAFVWRAEPEWEAIAAIQIGRVESQPIESAAMANERLKLRPFTIAVYSALEIPLDEARRDVQLYQRSMRSRLIPLTDLIEIRVRGHSREQAKEWAEEIATQLRTIHQKLAAPSISRLQQELDEVSVALEQVRVSRGQLLEDLPARKQVGPGNRFAESVLMANIVASQEHEMRELRKRALVLREQLSSAKTYPTALVNQVYVPERPVFPNIALTLAAAGVTGLILGILVALILAGFREPK